MKEKKEIGILIVEIIIGIIFAGVGLATSFDYYSSLLFSMGFAFAVSATVQILRIMYWTSPKHVQEYEERKREAHINSIDERLRSIREKAGYVTCLTMAASLCVLIFILSLLRVERWVLLMMVLLFLFQLITWEVVYRRLKRRM